MTNVEVHVHSSIGDMVFEVGTGVTHYDFRVERAEVRRLLSDVVGRVERAYELAEDDAS